MRAATRRRRCRRPVKPRQNGDSAKKRESGRLGLVRTVRLSRLLAQPLTPPRTTALCAAAAGVRRNDTGCRGRRARSAKPRVERETRRYYKVQAVSVGDMARPRGFEPLTPRSVVWCSILRPLDSLGFFAPVWPFWASLDARSPHGSPHGRGGSRAFPGAGRGAFPAAVGEGSGAQAPGVSGRCRRALAMDRRPRKGRRRRRATHRAAAGGAARRGCRTT